jgi:electron transfer flavoprotein alpha subunit
MTILVLAEHDNAAIKPATLNAVGAAQKLGGDIHVLVAGSGCAAAANAAAQVNGINKVLLADDAALSHGMAESAGILLAELGKNYSHILAAATTYGKNILPRAAALLDVQQISEVSAIIDAKTFERPVYAGNALARVQSVDDKIVMTIRATGFDPVPAIGGAASIENVNVPSTGITAQFIKEELSKSARPELTAAKIVVSGGRGMGSGENFAIIEKLADKIGAAVGASRAAVDAGFVPNDYQVGQTGKVVAPDLYVAVGISGAIQHLAGMKDSKVIVAINKDADAPIFQVADYGLVADLFQTVPEFTDKV